MAGEPEKGVRETIVSEGLRERIRPVSHFVTDVDGVLTDGRIIMDDDGREIKHFHVRDGHGLKLLQRAGIRVILLTGRTSRVVSHRARDLGIEEVYQGAKNKVSVLEEIMARHGSTAAGSRTWGTTSSTPPCSGGWAFPPPWPTRRTTFGGWPIM
jgi:hypothetical protein